MRTFSQWLQRTSTWCLRTIGVAESSAGEVSAICKLLTCVACIIGTDILDRRNFRVALRQIPSSERCGGATSSNEDVSWMALCSVR